MGWTETEHYREVSAFASSLWAIRTGIALSRSHRRASERIGHQS